MHRSEKHLLERGAEREEELDHFDPAHEKDDAHEPNERAAAYARTIGSVV